jgi:hypothetical protein
MMLMLVINTRTGMCAYFARIFVRARRMCFHCNPFVDVWPKSITSMVNILC